MLQRLVGEFKLIFLVVLLPILVQTAHSVTLNEDEKICVEQLNLNKTIIEAWNIEPELPEDNEEIRRYIECYWKRLGYLDEDGEFNYVKIGEVVHGDLKSRFQSDCVRIAAYVVDTCKNTVNADSSGLKAIRMWNCLNVYTENLF